MVIVMAVQRAINASGTTEVFVMADYEPRGESVDGWTVWYEKS
jgi:hypothetical protein